MRRSAERWRKGKTWGRVGGDRLKRRSAVGAKRERSRLSLSRVEWSAGVTTTSAGVVAGLRQSVPQRPCWPYTWGGAQSARSPRSRHAFHVRAPLAFSSSTIASSSGLLWPPLASLRARVRPLLLLLLLLPSPLPLPRRPPSPPSRYRALSSRSASDRRALDAPDRRLRLNCTCKRWRNVCGLLLIATPTGVN